MARSVRGPTTFSTTGTGRAISACPRFWRHPPVDSPLAGTRVRLRRWFGARVVFCGWCGQSNDDDAELCVQCGLFLHSGVLPMRASEPPAAALPRTHLRLSLACFSCRPMPETAAHPAADTNQQRSISPSPNRSSGGSWLSDHPAPATTEGPPRSRWASAAWRPTRRVISLVPGSSSGAAPQIRVRRTPSQVRPVSPVASPASPAAAASPCQVHPRTHRVRWSPGQTQPLGPPRAHRVRAIQPGGQYVSSGSSGLTVAQDWDNHRGSGSDR